MSKDKEDAGAAYWSANLRLLTICLSIWFFCSYVLGIFLVDFMNTFMLGGYPLGFWFAQQGSMYTFLVLIVFYAIRMGQIDRKYGMEE
jgi:putative solute:sodium symporter small subunit